MEDDDEFGDLYTDVLRTFPSSSSSAPRPPHTEAPPSRPIDIDLQSDVDAPSAALDSNFTGSEAGNTDSSRLSDSKPEAVAGPASKIWESPSAAAEVSAIRVLHTADLNLAVEEEEDAPLQDQKGANKLNVIGADKDGDFDIIEHNLSAADQLNGSMEDLDSEPIIPGLATPPLSNPASDVGPAADFGSSKCDGVGGEGDDWDSDSEDDLQIVLNDNNHGPMGMETNGLMVAANDDDEDEEPLVIVADNDVGHQPAEEQDWGEDQGQPSDGKEIADPSKANGGLVAAPKTGYSNYGYHPFHSQFKVS
uniref:Uncharacterized protein n=1 Tax=Opuntia streptacantha TaxID=393608 RepID=A0A7C8Z4X7_OPUST